MGGWNASDSKLVNFERLDAGALLVSGQAAVAWESLSIDNLGAFLPRAYSLMAPIGDQKIIIMGGRTDGGVATDGFELDCE